MIDSGLVLMLNAKITLSTICTKTASLAVWSLRSQNISDSADWILMKFQYYTDYPGWLH